MSAASGARIPVPPQVAEFISLATIKRPNPAKGALGTLGRSMRVVANNTLHTGSLDALGLAGIMGRYYRLQVKHTYPTLFRAIDRLIEEIKQIFRGLLDPASGFIALDTDRVVKNFFELAVEELQTLRIREPRLVKELEVFLAFLREFYHVQSALIKRRYPPNLASTRYTSPGAGGYGIVFNPAFPNSGEDGEFYSFPQNVVKVFYTPANQADAIAQYRQLGELIGPNVGHRFQTYRHQYYGRDLSHEIKGMFPARHLPYDTTPLSLLRMPNLGVDLEKVQANIEGEKASIYSVPLTDLLVQIHKLVGQVARLVKRDYVHGDIRSMNVMIQPSNGVMTLIDFDFLRPREEFKALILFRNMIGFFNNPPEGLIYRKLVEDPISRARTPESIRLADVELYTSPAVVRNYLIDGLNDFHQFYHQSGATNETILGQLVRVSNLANVKQFLHNFNRAETKFFKSYDSYSLSLTLQNFLANLIPDLIPNFEGNRVAEIVASLDSFHGPYTAAQKALLGQCILEFLDQLSDMSAPLLKDRKNATEVIGNLTTSLTTLFTGLGTPMPAEVTILAASVGAPDVSPEMPSEPAAAAAAPAASAPALAAAVAEAGPAPIVGAMPAARPPIANVAIEGFENVPLYSRSSSSSRKTRRQRKRSLRRRRA
jgi:serine/threonine protein kinase